MTSSAGHLSLEATEWLINGKFFESPTEVVSKGTVKFTDEGFNGLGTLVAECASKAERKIDPGSGSEVTAVKLTGCKYTVGAYTNICESTSSVVAVDLPWRTALATTEGSTRESISSSSGAPGFEVKCVNSVLGVEKDKCTGNTSAAMAAVTGGVDETFDSHSAKLNCSRTGTGKGLLEGTSLLESPGAGALAFQT